ncbi:MAG TPA: hypothetical protein VFH56_01385 [Acidimicrobiales bacterium]|nr:hypothetical protein [Acidimicrobiales bacterium]
MAERKPREQEEFEAFERAKRGLQRKLEDIAWKHEEFLPRLQQFQEGRLHINGKPKLELESGEDR